MIWEPGDKYFPVQVCHTRSRVPATHWITYPKARPKVTDNRTRWNQRAGNQEEESSTLTGKTKRPRRWGGRDECILPEILVAWVSLSSADPFNSVVLREVIYCSVIWKHNWFGLDFWRRRKGTSPESGALHGLLRFPSRPSYQCSHSMTWSGASDTSSRNKLYWFSSMLRREGVNNTHAKKCRLHNMISLATPNKWSGLACMGNGDKIQAKLETMKMVAFIWPLRSQPLDRIS